MQSIHPSYRRGLGGVLFLLPLLLLARPAHAATFSLLSQNCLHLGWGANPNKAVGLQTEFGLVPFDVILLQEVMAGANVAAFIDPNQVGNYTIRVSGLKGSTGYKEAYAFIVHNNIPSSVVVDYPDPNGDFSRPPSGVLLQTGGNWTWVVDYHAVFGRRKAVRVAEVQAMSGVYQWFQGFLAQGVAYPRVIIGGDWNLPGTDAAFGPLLGLTGTMTLAPDTATSLKRNGGLSQRYDHFVWDTNHITVNNPSVVPGVNGNAWWRANVSDHLGIACQVNY